MKRVTVGFRNLAALLLLAAAAASSWYFSRPPATRPEAGSGTGEASLGYYLRDATVFGWDESGRALFRIRAAEAVQDGDEEGLTLTDVRVEYLDEESVSWSITADQAEAPGDRGYIELEGVRLEREASEAERHTVIESPYLTFVPDEYYASTDAPVDVRIGETALHGVGLEARLREDHIELKSKVHGRFTR